MTRVTVSPPGARAGAARLDNHVDRLGEEHPPIDVASVDFTVRDPRATAERFGHVLDYMARVELEVDRNVLELMAMLPDPPEVDRRFYADVWQPQEIAHGRVLDELQTRLGRPPATPGSSRRGSSSWSGGCGSCPTARSAPTTTRRRPTSAT